MTDVRFTATLLGAEEALAALDALAAAARACAKTVGQSAREMWRLKCSTRGKKRPGQWSWQTRMKRAGRVRRLAKAALQRYHRRERDFPPRMNRQERRRAWRTGVEWRATDLGLAPLPGEPTKALFARVVYAEAQEMEPKGDAK